MGPWKWLPSQAGIWAFTWTNFDLSMLETLGRCSKHMLRDFWHCKKKTPQESSLSKDLQEYIQQAHPPPLSFLHPSLLSLSPIISISFFKHPNPNRRYQPSWHNWKEWSRCPPRRYSSLQTQCDFLRRWCLRIRRRGRLRCFVLNSMLFEGEICQNLLWGRGGKRRK